MSALLTAILESETKESLAAMVVDLRERNATLEKARDFLHSRGYHPCDIPACNCGSFHGGNADARLMEIADYIHGCGMWQGTILASIQYVFRVYGLDEDDYTALLNGALKLMEKDYPPINSGVIMQI